MNQIALIIGSIFGLTSIIFGAFGSHLLEKLISNQKLESFEVGVRYQMYHALLLMLIGFCFELNTSLNHAVIWLIVAGVILFSGSIYILSLESLIKIQTKIIGPITPIGGLLLILGWLFLLISVIKN